MKNVIHSFSILSFFLIVTINAKSQEQNEKHRGTQLLEAAIENNQSVGMAAGICINGAVTWQDAEGLSDLKNKQPFTPTTPTRIASITKTMTAIAILQLYEKGLVDLEAPIQAYIPDFPVKPEGELSIRHLLQHSSGINGYKNKKEQENTQHYAQLKDAVDLFKDRDLLFAPGQSFYYTSYGYVLLGHVIEKVTGLDYATYLKRNIWDAAQMYDTGIESLEAEVPDKSLLYHKNSKGKIKEANTTDLSDRIPGGGVYSTLTDMLKFGAAILDFRLIKEPTFKMMLEDPKLKKEGNGYGMGLYLYGENPKFGPIFGHNGTQTGASTFMMLLPNQEACIVVLSNTSGAIQSVSNITVQLFDATTETKD